MKSSVKEIFTIYQSIISSKLHSKYSKCEDNHHVMPKKDMKIFNGFEINSIDMHKTTISEWMSKKMTRKIICVWFSFNLQENNIALVLPMIYICICWLCVCGAFWDIREILLNDFLGFLRSVMPKYTICVSKSKACNRYSRNCSITLNVSLQHKKKREKKIHIYSTRKWMKWIIDNVIDSDSRWSLFLFLKIDDCNSFSNTQQQPR